MTDESAYVAPSKEVSIRGELLTVHQLKLRQIMGLLKPLSSVISSLPAGEDEVSVVSLISTNSDAFFEILGAAVSKSAHWVGDLSGKDALVLGAAFLAVNGDFFSLAFQLLAPKARRA